MKHVGLFGKFNVTLVRKGECYGRSGCLVHASDDPLVEFYDSRHVREDPLGQFVASYCWSTIEPLRGGLCLHADLEGWTIGGEDLLAALHALRKEIAVRPLFDLGFEPDLGSSLVRLIPEAGYIAIAALDAAGEPCEIERADCTVVASHLDGDERVLHRLINVPLGDALQEIRRWLGASS